MRIWGKKETLVERILPLFILDDGSYCSTHLEPLKELYFIINRISKDLNISTTNYILYQIPKPQIMFNIILKKKIVFYCIYCDLTYI